MSKQISYATFHVRCYIQGTTVFPNNKRYQVSEFQQSRVDKALFHLYLLLYSIKLIIAYLCSSIKIKKIKFLSKLEMILDRKAEFGRAADLKKS
jgi:hypothetical protein